MSEIKKNIKQHRIRIDIFNNIWVQYFYYNFLEVVLLKSKLYRKVPENSVMKLILIDKEPYCCIKVCICLLYKIVRRTQFSIKVHKLLTYLSSRVCLQQDIRVDKSWRKGSLLLLWQEERFVPDHLQWNVEAEQKHIPRCYIVQKRVSYWQVQLWWGEKQSSYYWETNSKERFDVLSFIS